MFVKQAQHKARLPVLIDERIPVDAASIPGGMEATIGFPELFGMIELSKE